MSVTLKDLAKACGVSVGTVSRALNEKNEVSTKTSSKIRQLAMELGYIPNRAGRALSTRKNPNYIGIVLPSINSPFFDDIKRGIDQACRENRDLGVEVIMEEVDSWETSVHLNAIQRLESRGVKAMALCSADAPAMRDKIAELSDRNIPVLLINNDLPDARRIAFVGPDYYRSGQIAAAMLDKCRQGQKLSVLIVVGYKQHLGHHRRMEGFIDELKRRNADFSIEEVIEGHDRDIDTQQAAMSAFVRHPDSNVVYMATGSGVSGLGAAIIADSKHRRFVIACDEIYTTRELVKNDIIDFVICQETFTQGYQAIRKLQDVLGIKTEAACQDYIVDNIIKLKNHFEI